VIEPGSIKFGQVHTCVHTLMCTRLLYARSQYRSPAAAVPPAVHTVLLQHAVLAFAGATLCGPVHLCSRCGSSAYHICLYM
jgi:hypothetical protein